MQLQAAVGRETERKSPHISTYSCQDPGSNPCSLSSGCLPCPHFGLWLLAPEKPEFCLVRVAALTPGLANAANAHTFLIFSQASGFCLESPFHTADVILVLTVCLHYPGFLLGSVKKEQATFPEVVPLTGPPPRPQTPHHPHLLHHLPHHLHCHCPDWRKGQGMG